jgi:hypothetical protein
MNSIHGKTFPSRKAFALVVLLFATIWLVAAECSSFAEITNQVQEKLFVIPFSKGGKAHRKVSDHYGVPFVASTLRFDTNGEAQINIGCHAQRIFLLGMAESATIRCWADPNDNSARFFVGDNLGQIRLNYADGTTENFPLILGESTWFGPAFDQYPEPFPTDAKLRQAFADAMNLYPMAPPPDGNYLAVITPRPEPIQSITIENSPDKQATPIINGITIETTAMDEMSPAIEVTPGTFSPELEKFIKEKSLREDGTDVIKSQNNLEALRMALYSSDKTFFQSRVTPQTPAGYSGPQVSFAGSLYADILANAFSFNVQDISDKIDDDGMYHTSTKGATSWNGNGFGTFRTNAGMYYATSWCRDMGRSLQEITILGYTNDALRCADYCLRMAKLWEDPANAYQGHILPPHWGRMANRPRNAPPFENDGHGMVSMFLYKLWQRLPDRDDWLRARWPDIKNAGDWVLWQFDHPEISGATNGVLHTTGECAGGNGYSVYGDYACMNALRALAQMADSIGETNSAQQWRQCADKMQTAMGDQYIIDDPKYGRVWTLDYAGWPTHPTVLGPLIFLADYQGFAPQDDDSNWRPVNEAAYQRLIDTYPVFGFYGQAMGYGQGFVTESALLLDRMHDATAMLNWVAKQIYDPRFGCCITPEGVQVYPGGQYWFRVGDLGNGVQEAEIIKTLRLVIGVDDTQPDRLQFYPRMPYNWNEITVKKYPVLFEDKGITKTTWLQYTLKRSGNGMDLKISADDALNPAAMRLGPFEKQPRISRIWVNGQNPQGAVTEHSGDSWWVKFTMPIPEDVRYADNEIKK